MGTMASQITSITIVYLTVYSGADRRKHPSSASLALCAGNSPVTGEFPAQMASNAENDSVWWRHHGAKLANIAKAVCWGPFQNSLLTLLFRSFYIFSSIWNLHLSIYGQDISHRISKSTFEILRKITYPCIERYYYILHWNCKNSKI